MGMLLQEVPHQRGFVSREVVEDDVDLLPGRAEGDNFLQEGNEVLTGVASGSLSVNPAGGRFQCRIEGERAVPVVLEAVTFGAAGGKRQYWIEPVQSLNGSLFIHAENGRMLGRVQRQADNVGRLALKIGIITGHVPLQPMRLQAGFFPDPMHSVLADTQFGSELAAAPMRGTILRRSAGSRENPRPQFWSDHESRLPGMTGVESVDARSEETLLPSDDGRSIGAVVPSFC
jgi:hypothetical protein